jgi:CrcB protein
VQVRTYLLISLGGIAGANARYLVGLWAATRWGTAFPWGTLLVNTTGSFMLGFLLTLVLPRFGNSVDARLLLGTGFCGAYTTFSTFSYETVTLMQRGLVLDAALYAAGSLALGLLAISAGILAARLL